MAKLSTISRAARLIDVDGTRRVSDALAAHDGTMGALITGRPAIASASTLATTAGTFIFANPVTRTSIRTILRIRNPKAFAGTIYLARFTFDGTNFQRVPGSVYVPVDVPAGPADLRLPITFYLPRGEYVGFSTLLADRLPAYQTGTAGDDGGYFYHNVALPDGAFSPSGGRTGNIQLQIGIEGLYSLALDDMQPQIDANVTATAAALASANRARGALAVAVTGRPSITDVSASACNAGTYIFATPIKRSGTRHTLRTRRSIPGSLTIALGRFTFDGTQFQQVAGTAYVPVTIAGGGNGTATISFYAAKGEYLGFSVPGEGAVGVCFNTALPGDGGGYFYHNIAQPAGAFVPSGGKTANIQLQLGIDGDYALAYDDALAELQPQLDTARSASTRASSNAAVARAGLRSVTQGVRTEVFSRLNAAGVGFATGAPSTKMWTPGFRGSSLAEDTTLDYLSTVLHRDASAVTFEAMLCSRPLTKLSEPDDLDTAEWSSWVSVDATALPVATFGRVYFAAKDAPVVDREKSYYLKIRAKDASGGTVAFGCGRTDGAGLDQVERGFYRNPGDTAWSAIGASAGLPAVVETNILSIKASVLPAASAGSSAPSKKRGMLIMLGRSELVFDNTAAGGTTFRRLFALPLIVKRVVNVIFAHASTVAHEITRASVAPITSLASVNGDGAAWTALTFGAGTVRGVMPAAAGAQRWGWLASRENPIELLPRTDIPGAAKLVMISAYMGVSGSPILLGKSGTDDYKTNWEARTDFPMIMRHNAGDCVTTPASFTSALNDTNGTPIAGLVCETEDGQLVTYAFDGDSISNGAGISVGGVVRYGQGWCETFTYGQNSRYRGALPVLLGWSGLSMQGIRNNALDFYAFIKANNLPAPNVFYAPNASPNSMGTPLLEAQMIAQRALSDDIVGVALGAGSQVVKWLCLPVDPTTKDLDPTPDPNDGDKFRRNYNDADRSEGNLQRGLIVADFDALMTNGFDADGQALFNDDYEDDGIHPNAAGHAALASIAARASRPALIAAGYAVGGLIT